MVYRRQARGRTAGLCRSEHTEQAFGAIELGQLTWQSPDPHTVALVQAVHNLNILSLAKRWSVFRQTFRLPVPHTIRRNNLYQAQRDKGRKSMEMISKITTKRSEKQRENSLANKLTPQQFPPSHGTLSKDWLEALGARAGCIARPRSRAAAHHAARRYHRA